MLGLDAQQGPQTLRRMEVPKRKALPHDVPLWIQPDRETYFITINCQQRGVNQLALPEIAAPLFETVEFRQRNFTWWCQLMPDHLHTLMSFPDSGKSIQLRVSQWKEWTAKQFGLVWQRDFFEHRLRGDEGFVQKGTYILENPVRKGLVAEVRDWPFVYFAEGPRPYGWSEKLAFSR